MLFCFSIAPSVGVHREGEEHVSTPPRRSKLLYYAWAALKTAGCVVECVDESTRGYPVTRHKMNLLFQSLDHNYASSGYQTWFLITLVLSHQMSWHSCARATRMKPWHRETEDKEAHYTFE